MDTSAAGDTIVLSSKLKSREAALRGGRVEVDDAAQLRVLVDTSGALRAAGVPHALIGGIAVGVRSGVARATVGVDLAVHSTAEVEVLIATMRAAAPGEQGPPRPRGHCAAARRHPGRGRGLVRPEVAWSVSGTADKSIIHLRRR